MVYKYQSLATEFDEAFLMLDFYIKENTSKFILKISHCKKLCNGKMGSSEEDEVFSFFVLSHLWMRGYFRLSKG